MSNPNDQDYQSGLFLAVDHAVIPDSQPKIIMIFALEWLDIIGKTGGIGCQDF